MKESIVNWLKANGAKHLEALVIAGALVFGGRAWLQEHDARLQADTQVKSAQSAIDSLKAQQNTVRQEADKQVIVLQKEAAAVQTAPQAIQALQKDPEVKAALPTLETVPNAPDQVQVNALDLFKGVNKCEQDAVNLGACTKELDLQKQIDTQKDTQITALKKKPGFWSRLGKGAKIVGCSAAGGALGSLAKSPQGAAIGAAAGAGVCQIF